MTQFITQLIAAFVVGILCSIFFNAPKSTWIQSAITSLIGWLVSYIFMEGVGLNTAVSTYFASVVVSALAQYFARRYKKPSSAFFIPGFFTLVPGRLMYQTTYEFLEGNSAAGSAYLLEVGYTAVAIAMGVFTVDAIIYMLTNQAESIEANERAINRKIAGLARRMRQNRKPTDTE